MSLFRIGGIASGIDFNSVIDQMIAIERKPINLMLSKKDVLSWKKDFWSEIDTTLKSLDASIQTLLKKSTMMARTATTTDTDTVTATATSDAALATYAVNVTNLATSTKVTSGAGASGRGISGTIDADAAVSSSSSKFYLNPTAGTFTVNGVLFTLTDTDDDSIIDKIDVTDASGGTSYHTYTRSSGITLNDIISAFKDTDVVSAAGLDATDAASYNSTTDKFAIKAAAGGDLNLGSAGDTSNFLTAVGLLSATQSGDTKTSVSHLGRIRLTQTLAGANFTSAISGTGSFKINGVEISYDASTDTVQNMLDRINSSTAGVNATYDSIQDRIVLANKNTGSLSISRADVSSGVFLANTNLLDAGGATQALGENATFTLNGGDTITSLSNDVSGIVAGVTFNLKEEASATITIGKDNAKAKEAVKDFVNKYNAAITIINTRLSEQKVKDPKTTADKKIGLFRSDRVLMDIKNKLINKATSSVPGLTATLNELSEIGITLTSDNYGKASTLVLNETKLDEKLNENAAAVASLFFNDTDGDGVVDTGEDGVAARLSEYMDKVLDEGGKDTVTRNEDNDSKITYSGTWSTVVAGDASGDEYKQSSTVGDYLEFTFTGSKIAWYATKGSGLGTAEVYIDGVYKEDIDLSNATTQYQQNVFVAQGLSDGSHTIKIKVKSGTVNIDSLDATFTSSTGVVPRQKSVLQTQMKDIDKRVTAMEERITKREETLIKQFTAMEKAIHRLQQISSRFQIQMSGMFGG